MTKKIKKESISDKKERLLKYFEEKFREQSESENSIEEEKKLFIIDNTLPKNTMILTNHETGESLKVKIKFTNDKLVFTNVTVLK